jgi:hypothetical protein
VRCVGFDALSLSFHKEREKESRAGILFSACGVFSLPAPENFALQNSPQRK